MFEDEKVPLQIGVWIVGCLLGVVLLVGGAWLAAAHEIAFTSVFYPAREQVRRNTFEQSKAYNQGMQQELDNMRFEYVQADKEHKDALASIILHRVADYDERKLKPDMQEFIRKLRKEQGVTL